MRITFFLSFLLLLFIGTSCSDTNDSKTIDQTPSTDNYYQGMVSTAHPLASEVGVQILKDGGNAFDAAVAVQFALAVVYPRAGNIAGGGFAVFRTSEGESGTLDFREKAPLAAGKDMYLDKEKNVVPNLSSFGILSVGVPGTVDGMIKLHQKYGKLPFEDLVQPAIDLAKNGFALTEAEADKLNKYQEAFILANDSDFVLLNPTTWKTGDKLILKNLAATLTRIQKDKRAGFYKGLTAQYLLDEMAEEGGIITQEDLDKYESVWRAPSKGTYRGYDIISMPPPSSGGVALLQLLKGAEAYDVASMGYGSADAIHLMTELERRVYADRATYMGDPDYYKVPAGALLNADYIKQRNASISMSEKTNSSDIKEGELAIAESMETTHFSIVDKDKNAVSITTTLNGNYGSKVFVENGGFLLNNEMDDFSAKPGVPNLYGLVGGLANAIAPEKRMLSSMTPTIVEKDGKLFMVVGSPGGSTIITSVYQTILNVIDYGMDIQTAIDVAKFHHQWLPDNILYEENRLDSATIKQLQKRGHVLQPVSSIGRVDAVLVGADGALFGGADTLRGDDVSVGY